mgnify:CR=1 FL=1
MLAILWSSLLGFIAVPLTALVVALRRWQLGKRGVLEISFANDMPRRADLEGVASTNELLDALAGDPLLRAVKLRIRHPSMGWSAAQELHRRLRALRDAGKLVFVHLEVAGSQELMLAGAADRVWLEPAADVFLSGVGSELTFFGGLFEKLGVRFEVETAGEFKSFGESYSRSFASAPNRQAMSELVEDLADQLIESIAEGRGIPPETVRRLMVEAPFGAERALSEKLVDGLGHADQAHAAMEELLGQNIKPLSFRSYARLLRIERALSRWGKRERRVGVVHLEGAVVYGAEPSGGGGQRIDADRVVPVLDELAELDAFGAVVLFINSPGGSALASDIIARAVQRLGASKPVIAVFADTAASGGYYIGAPAAEIIASPGTVTGSIGVVGGKLDLSGLMATLGVRSEAVRSPPEGMSLGPFRPFEDEERRRFRELLLRAYQRFLQIVAAGRRRPVEAIEPFAAGRVWTGRQALQHGLVDRLGGLPEGIERARYLAGLSPESPTVHLRFPPPRFRLLAQLLGRDAQAPDLVELSLRTLGPLGDSLRLVRAMPGQALALLPWSVGRG